MTTTWSQSSVFPFFPPPAAEHSAKLEKRREERRGEERRGEERRGEERR
jgi:hypothetical protein